jgi:hypothetical protein
MIWRTIEWVVNLVSNNFEATGPEADFQCLGIVGNGKAKTTYQPVFGKKGVANKETLSAGANISFSHYRTASEVQWSYHCKGARTRRCALYEGTSDLTSVRVRSASG